jgi:hypothetical protein
MKILTLISFFTLTSFFANAENCKRTGIFFGAGDADVDVEGSVTLEVKADGSIKLNLSSGFLSDDGPDLDIYIGSTMRVDGLSIRLEALGSLSGAQSYVLPASISIADYSYVTIHCTQYNHYYGAALLGSSQGDCNTLSVNDASVPSDISFKADAYGVTINSSKLFENVTATIFSVNGTMVSKTIISQLVDGVTLISGDFPTVGVLVLSGSDIAFRGKYVFNLK